LLHSYYLSEIPPNAQQKLIVSPITKLINNYDVLKPTVELIVFMHNDRM